MGCSRRFLLALGLLLLTAALGTTADDKDKEKEDTKMFQGVWVVTAADFAGAKDSDSQDATLTIDGGKFTIKTAKGEHRGTFRLDPKKKPKAIDILGPKEDQVGLGIYEVTADSLKICWDQQDKASGRPTEFVTKANTDLRLLVLKRPEKKKE